MRRPIVGAAAAALAAAVLAGCASVPGHSSVQVLRQIGDNGTATVPAGPIEDRDPLGLVRGFVYASGQPDDRHASARRYLAPQASNWDDGASLTILDERFDTVFSPDGTTDDPNRATVRIRGTRLGTLDPFGAFEASPAPVEVDVGVVNRDGHWRIDGLPPGVLVRGSDFRANYRSLKAWFVDPVHHTVLADQHYIPSAGTTALATRAVEVLLHGPSAGLQGAATTAFPPGAKLRSNLTESADGVVVLDLAGVDGLAEADRRLLAAQLALTLAEVSVPRVRILSDGEPLLAGRPDIGREDVLDLVAGPPASAPLAAMVIEDGRVRALGEAGQDTPLPGQAGNGSFFVTDAASSSRSNRIAVVSREDSGTQRLLTGPVDGQLSATPVSGGSLTSTTWNAAGDEVWVLADGAPQRVVVPETGPARQAPLDAGEITSRGPVRDLVLSRDGVRVAAVAGGHALVGAVVTEPGGAVAVRQVRELRPAELDGVVALDWRAGDQLVVAANSDQPVSLVSVDGLTLDPMPSVNLTSPLRAVAAAPGRAMYVADRTGVWSFAGGDLDAWQQALGATSDAQPFYPS
ncbi:MAG: LpqB family beta-propeller domain-containing protein [Pseudonocardia sp.]|nr:LpqB family beta-propeller domain-containing protein [Pseudonocardia sp.]